MGDSQGSKGMAGFKPSVFITKGGVRVQTRPHFATFNEKHNASRVKCYLVLYHHRYKLQEADGLTLGELHRASGVNYNYIKSKIAFWCSWGFCKRKVALGDGKPAYRYSLDKRGKHFIEDIVPREWLEHYIRELQHNKAVSHE